MQARPSKFDAALIVPSTTLSPFYMQGNHSFIQIRNCNSWAYGRPLKVQPHLFDDPSKGGFFSESAICFSNLPISQKKYSKKLS